MSIVVGQPGIGPGFMRKGLRYRVEIRKKSPFVIKWAMFMQNLITTEFMNWVRYSPDIAGLVPFFNIANYTEDEAEGMRKIHPHFGGTLRRSAHVIFTNVTPDGFDIEIGWQTTYLRFLIEHGVTREPGTRLDWVANLMASGRMRIKILQIAKRAYDAFWNDKNYGMFSILRRGIF